jgi:hypothetical protein
MATLTVEGRSRTSPAAGSQYRRFRPRLVLGYQQDLQSLIEELTAMRTAEAGVVLDLAIEKLDERQEALQTFGLSGTDLTPTVRYGARGVFAGAGRPVRRAMCDLQVFAAPVAGRSRAARSTRAARRSRAR